MNWRRKGPGHQQPWYLECWNGLVQSPHVKGKRSSPSVRIQVAVIETMLHRLSQQNLRMIRICHKRNWYQIYHLEQVHAYGHSLNMRYKREKRIRWYITFLTVSPKNGLCVTAEMTCAFFILLFVRISLHLSTQITQVAKLLSGQSICNEEILKDMLLNGHIINQIATQNIWAELYHIRPLVFPPSYRIMFVITHLLQSFLSKITKIGNMHPYISWFCI